MFPCVAEPVRAHTGMPLIDVTPHLIPLGDTGQNGCEPLIADAFFGVISGRLARRLAVLTPRSLLVVDEIGYLPINRAGAVLFSQFVNHY